MIEHHIISYVTCFAFHCSWTWLLSLLLHLLLPFPWVTGLIISSVIQTFPAGKTRSRREIVCRFSNKSSYDIIYFWFTWHDYLGNQDMLLWLGVLWLCQCEEEICCRTSGNIDLLFWWWIRLLLLFFLQWFCMDSGLDKKESQMNQDSTFTEQNAIYVCNSVCYCPY